MKLNKAGFWVWPASLGAGFCLAYSVACHWFGFLLAAKRNRLEMLLAFGAIFCILSWQLVKRGSGFFSEKKSGRKFYFILGTAVLIAGAAAVFVLPLSQISLIPQSPQTTIMRWMWIGLRLADFVSLVCVLLLVEVILSLNENQRGSILRLIYGKTTVSPALGIVLIFCLSANLYISVKDKTGVLHHMKPLSSNSLLSVVWNQPLYMAKARGYTILFEHYQGWTLVAPARLLEKMAINQSEELQRWGRLGKVVTADYPTVLSEQEMQALLALKKVNVNNESGLRYTAILVGDSSHKVCLRTYTNRIFFVPVSLSPICESK
jgi:hypothetical protein